MYIYIYVYRYIYTCTHISLKFTKVKAEKKVDKN